MKKFHLSSAVCAFFIISSSITTNAVASVISISGLNWLSLDVTAGQAYNDALTLNPGFRYATNAEVEGLFGIAFPGFVADDPSGAAVTLFGGGYPNQDSQATNFHNLFGPSNTDSQGSYAIGVYNDESNILRIMGAFLGPGYTQVLGSDYINLAIIGTDQNPNYGIYLVQSSTVPVPAAFWLFGSGLLGLVGMARRKKAA